MRRLRHAFVGLLAGEIAQLRKIGRSDDDIAALIAAAIGRDVPASAIARLDDQQQPPTKSK